MVASEVTVEVPATSANLGPGFDSLGVALDWTLRLQFRLSDEPVAPYTDPIPALAARAALLLYERAALPSPAGIEVTYESDLPVGRGLGISAATRVAGLLAADALTGSGLDRKCCCRWPCSLSGTPTMRAGDVRRAARDRRDGRGQGRHADRRRLARELQLVLLIPAFSMPTEETRRRLPERLTRNQAVHNIGRPRCCSRRYSARRYDLLQIATEDVLHQPARATIFEPMYQIFQAARDAGAHGVYLSGGGPTIAALATERFAEIAGAMRAAAAARGVEASTRICALRTKGAEVLPAGGQ